MEKDKALKMKRIIMAFVGVILTGFCIGFFQKANLGTDPFTTFVTGIANIFHSTYGTFYIIVTGILLVLVFIVEKHYIGIATLINLLCTGMAADFMYNILHGMIPDPSMPLRIVFLAVGVIGTCFSASLYFVADLGVSAYDAWALMANEKYKIAAFRVCRITTDCICVLVGFIFKATVGVATIITALCMGPIVQFFNVHFSYPLLYGKKAGSDIAKK